jgi:apolipoprotein N-acyltransferase
LLDKPTQEAQPRWIKPWHAALLSAVLLGLSFPPFPFPVLILLAFVPMLLLVEDAAQWPGYSGSLWQRAKRYRRLLKYLYVCFLLWNIIAGYWLGLTGWGGLKDPVESALAVFIGSIASVVNALFMATPWLLYLFVRRRLPQTLSHIAFAAIWLAFEYGHLRWDLTWSWFNLGNSFAWFPAYIQYYEFTGVLGGTAFALISNLLLLNIWMRLAPRTTGLGFWRKFKQSFQYQDTRRLTVILLGLWVLPLVLNPIITNSQRAVFQPVGTLTVRVAQPNINPYETGADFSDMGRAKELADLIASHPLDSVDLALLPETTLPGVIEEQYIPQVGHYQAFRDLTNKYPRLSILSGMASFRLYPKGFNAPATARDYDGSARYDVYNSAVALPDSLVYHKGKLVPITERMPFAETLAGIMGDLHVDLGGGLGSYGLPDSVFPLRTRKGVPVAVMICYESVFGDFSRQAVQKGGEIGVIVTNDGWWGNTSGYIQHAAYSSLRAIEYRREIGRSANTGISQFVDVYGHPHQKLGWDVKGVETRKLNRYRAKTFFVQYGDWPGLLGRWLTVLFLVCCLPPFRSMIAKRAKLNTLETEKAA